MVVCDSLYYNVGDVGAAQTKPLHTTVPLTVPAARSPWVTSGYWPANASARAPSRVSDFANHVDKYVGYTFKTGISTIYVYVTITHF